MGIPQPGQVRSDGLERTERRAGYTAISSKALTRVVKAAAADVFAVPLARVTVHVHDDGGLLAIAVSAPLPVPPLDEAARRPELVGLGGGTLHERADAARRALGERVLRLTGSRAGRIDIRLTGARHEREAGLQ